VNEAFERELLERVREAVVPAERVAYEGGSLADIQNALATRSTLFEAPQMLTLEEMDGALLRTVEGQLMLYGQDPTGQRAHPFAAVLLRNRSGDVVGAGGWWFNPRAFIATQLRNVVQDRLSSIPRLYGGLESTRNHAVQVVDVSGNEVALVREPGTPNTSRAAEMTGPFEGFSVRVSGTRNGPVSIAARFVVVEVVFIGLLTLVLLAATAVGLRYILRQIELVQVKSSFVSNVTHELKTPISVIKLAAETLEMRRFHDPAEGEKYLLTILRETDRLGGLVDNILDFSRLEAGQKVLQFAAVAPSDLLDRVMESFRLRLEDQGFRFSVEVPAELPAVRGDVVALQHCLLNLLDNAVKYSRERKEVRIRAYAQEGFVGISVADRGIGIDAEHLEYIFEKFVRVETGLVHTVKGAGLGLSLVDLIIRAHHGRVEVASTVGEGSIFTLLIPVWEEGRTPPRRQPRVRRGQGPQETIR
jgi:signal transduction histidine kinase